MTRKDSDIRTKAHVERAAAILFWVAVWFAAAASLGNPLLLASPADTLAALAGQVGSGAFWAAVGSSGARIIGACVAASALGAAAGLLASRFPLAQRLAAPLVQVMKSAPVACVAVILLVVMGPGGAVAVIVAFVAAPPFYVAACEAAAMRDGDLARVLALSGVGKTGVFFAATWPACLPFFQAAAKTAVAMSWRAGVTAELLGVPLGSIGAAVYASKLTLDVAGLLAWTIVVMACGWTCEMAASWLLGLSGASPRIAVSFARRPSRARDGRRASVAARAACDPPAASAACDSAVVGAACNSAAVGVACNSVAAITSCSLAAANAPLLRMRNVSKSFGQVAVLEGTSLEVFAGERVCLMAPTGAGKTTLLRIALGLELPDAGEVTCASCTPVLQGSCLVENLTARENVMLVAGRAHDESFVSKKLDGLLPEGCAGKRACDLSGGTRRLVEIARAVLSDAPVVVLDEPFAGLDDDTRARACAFIDECLRANTPLASAVGGEPFAPAAGDVRTCAVEAEGSVARALVVATHNPQDAVLLGARIASL